MKSRAVVAASWGVPGDRMKMVTVGTLITILAVAGGSASAQTPPPQGPGMERSMFPGMHERMYGGMHERMRGGRGPEAMFRGSPERMGRMVDRMLDGLNATDAQRAQIKEIATAAATDLRAQAASGRGLRERSMQVFTAPTVDANAAEQLRQQMLQQHDQMSRRVTQALLDVSRVLTPEQRVKLGKRLHDRQARREDRMKRMQEHLPDRMQHREGQRR